MSTATAIPFNVARGRDGLSATTEVVLPESCGGRTLTISTSKRSRGITSHASAVMVKADDGSGFRTISFVLFGDFSKTVLTVQGRATEKTIRETHAAALLKLDDIVVEAVAFYVAKAAKEAA